MERLEGEERVAHLAAHAQAQEARVVEAQAALGRARDDVDVAQREVDAVATPRALVQEASALRKRLETFEVDVGRHHAHVLQAEERVRTLERASEVLLDGGLFARYRQAIEWAGLTAEDEHDPHVVGRRLQLEVETAGPATGHRLPTGSRCQPLHHRNRLA